MNTMWQLRWFISHKSVALTLLCQPIGIFRSLRESMTKPFSANTARVLSPSRSRTEGRVRWKKRNMLRECSVDAYRAAFILRGPCIPASTLSRMQALGSLLVWWTAHPPPHPYFPSRVVYILTLVLVEADRSCWIGYLLLARGHTTATRLLFLSDDSEKQCPLVVNPLMHKSWQSKSGFCPTCFLFLLGRERSTELFHNTYFAILHLYNTFFF